MKEKILAALAMLGASLAFVCAIASDLSIKMRVGIGLPAAAILLLVYLLYPADRRPQ